MTVNNFLQAQTKEQSAFIELLKQQLEVKAMQSIMAKILDEILKSEATEQIKARAYERSDERTNSRNGYRVRQLTTRVGTL
ncbi:transposase, Mutator family (plasmid) [Ligilactobacillus salivarius str. Ren]|uniref:Transposase, Mutator family n=1 Tax=Ligilactobacillus salivarius str. Ren TaxID=1194971 RepID=A0A0F7PZB5_9LACO|nr:transposase, Mutator family [Ligilactobacillus salivarius str. Ren]